MTIGEALRRFRAEFKLKQEETATALGLTRQAYYFYEVDKGIPPADKIVKLATTFNVSADYLLGLRDTPRPNEVSDDEIHKALALYNMVKSIK